MRMKQVIWNIGRMGFRMLPISLDMRIRMRDAVLTLMGEHASMLPQYHAWKRRKEEPVVAPVGIAVTPEQVWKEHYASDDRPIFLFASHDMGGGTEQHVEYLKNAVGKEGIRTLALRHGEPGSSRIFIQGFAPDATARMEFDLPKDYSALVSLLKITKLRHIHVHHTLYMPEGIVETLQDLSTDLGVPYDYTAHDYLSICPRFTLYQDGLGGYCGEPDIMGCTGCLATYGSTYGNDVNMKEWRDRYAKFLTAARRVFTPDQDVTDRLLKYFPAAKIETRPHEEDFPAVENFSKPRLEGEPLKVVILGAISPFKGANIIFNCAKDALDRKLNIHFTIIGYTSEDWRRKPYSNMTITGKYTNQQLHEWLEGSGFHLSFFPAVWPETYSYTLSLAMRYGLHPVSFDIGAVGRRIKASGFGTILPYRDFRTASRINDWLLSIKPTEAPADLMEKNFTKYPSYIKDYYELPETVKA